MLAREQWTKPSLEDFLAWLETKPSDEKYWWPDASICACGQYAASIGIVSWVGGAATCPVFEQINRLAQYRPRTFGALLGRALEAKARASR
jgi:hypothetical protein